MDTHDLLKCLSKQTLGTKIIFLGVFCSDQLLTLDILRKKKPNKPFMFISNTLKTSDPPQTMGHWVAIYCDKTKVVFLDSFGFHPLTYGEYFQKFIDKLERGNTYAFKEGFQPLNSLTCGLYSIFFVHYTSHYGLRQCIKHTYQNFKPFQKNQNDVWIKKYFALDLEQSCQLWLSQDEKAMTYEECMKYKVSFFFPCFYLLFGFKYNE